MTANNGLPSMVDKSKFALGQNLGLSPGKVVYAEEHLELIQYAPQTDQVYQTWSSSCRRRSTSSTSGTWRPALDRGVPGRARPSGLHRELATYRRSRPGDLESYAEASTAPPRLPAISGSPELNLVGACSGGITTRS
jgi:polyhydroxyalkanoate synthase